MTTTAIFRGDLLQMEGSLGDLSRWVNGDPALISVKYNFGDMRGELSGSVGQIFADGSFSLSCTFYGDHFATVADFLKLDSAIEADSFWLEGQLEGNWAGISLERVSGKHPLEAPDDPAGTPWKPLDALARPGILRKLKIGLPKASLYDQLPSPSSNHKSINPSVPKSS